MQINKKINKLKKIAIKIRKSVIKTVYFGNSGHCGGSLSAVDILVVLYFYAMKHDSKKPKWEERDRFILSKGHACPALYSVLAECGYFEKSELKKFRHINSLLQGHPHFGIPGIEVPTGSLGQGISMGVGIAMGLKYLKKNNRVYVLIGDGESQEGQVWEAAMAAGNYKLDNLIVFLDRNKLQGCGFVEKTMSLEPLAEKWRAFKWVVREINGNNIADIIDSIEWAKLIKGKPKMIISDTIKGKGISFMENIPKWHGTDPPTEEEFKMAIEILSKEEDR